MSKTEGKLRFSARILNARATLCANPRLKCQKRAGNPLRRSAPQVSKTGGKVAIFCADFECAGNPLRRSAPQVSKTEGKLRFSARILNARATLCGDPRLKCQKLEGKLRFSARILNARATLCGDPRVKCQKLRGKVAIFCADFECAGNPLRRSAPQVSKAEGKFRFSDIIGVSPGLARCCV